MAMKITGIDKDFILNSLFLENVTLLIRINIIVETRMTSFNPSNFNVEIRKDKTSLFRRGLEIELSFNFQGKSMNFKTHILAMSINTASNTTILTLQKPDYLISNLLRKYERITPLVDNVKTTAEIEIEKPDFFIKKEEFLNLISDQYDDFAIDSSILFEKITSYFDSKGYDYETEFFQDVGSYSFEASLIKAIGKVLYFPLSRVNEKNSNYLISIKEILRSFGDGKEILEEHKSKLSSKYLTKLEEKMIEKNYSFIAYFPIYIGSDMIGSFIVKSNKSDQISDLELEIIEKNSKNLALKYENIKGYRALKYSIHSIEDVYIDNLSGNGVMLYYFKNYEKFFQLVDKIKINYNFVHTKEIFSFETKIAWRDYSQDDFNFIGVAYKEAEKHPLFNNYLKAIYGIDYATKLISKMKEDSKSLF